MEALRYLPFLSKEGWIITSSAPFVNIPNYPEIDTIKADLEKLPNVIMLDIEQKAKDAGIPRSANVILLGAAQKALGIEYDKLEDAIRRVFGRKGDAIVEANIKALVIGREAQKYLLLGFLSKIIKAPICKTQVGASLYLERRTYLVKP